MSAALYEYFGKSIPKKEIKAMMRKFYKSSSHKIPTTTKITTKFIPFWGPAAYKIALLEISAWSLVDSIEEN